MKCEKELQLIRKTALKFLEAAGELTIENILHYIKTNTPFTVHFFTENDELLEQFSLQDIKTKGFIYKSKPFHYIFVNKSLSAKEKIEVLIHEIGHVILDKELLSTSEKEIYANIFSYFVLKYGYENIFVK